MALFDTASIPEEILLSLGKLVASQYSPEQIFAEVARLEANLKPISDEIAKVKSAVSELIHFIEPEAQTIVQTVTHEAETVVHEVETVAQEVASGAENLVREGEAAVEGMFGQASSDQPVSTGN